MSIFTEGSCLKSELLPKIVEIMVAAGWRNISSNPATEGYVMYSKGESGDKDLVFQIRPLPVNGAVAGDIHTSTAVVMSTRLIGGYTPNETEGVDGVIDRPAEVWRALPIAPAVVSHEVELNYWYSVNKDRIIFNIYTPESLALLPVLFYIGIPTAYNSEPKSRGLVYGVSMTATTANNLLITDNVAELPSVVASFVIPNQVALPPKSPNSAGKHTPVECLYGNAAVGIRGKIDSLLFLPNGSINNGDILRVGAKRFRATSLAISGANAFPSSVILYQIS